MNAQECRACKFWKVWLPMTEPDAGCCRAHPPQVISFFSGRDHSEGGMALVADVRGNAAFPLVHGDETCGEFVPG